MCITVYYFYWRLRRVWRKKIEKLWGSKREGGQAPQFIK
jgi:hypothetical protein